MADPVVHFEVVGQDGEALRSFYGDLFGWKIEGASEEVDYGLVAAPKGGIAGGIGSAPSGGGHVTFYVQVGDLQAALDKAESLGGKTVMPPSEVPGGTKIALFADPEEHVIGLIEG